MSQFVQRRPPRRAPRASVRGTVSALIRLENGRQFSARVQQLSITGGLLDVAAYVEERTWVKLTVYLAGGLVRATAEMMFPMRGGSGYLQPFRFVSLGADELHVLDREVTALLKESATSSPGDLGFRAPRYYLDTW
ncbi:MAG TPA: hypothetical protein VMU05_05610 [Dongiaceae bacterium]|nr:hypothetical protein [Dongiaceae bacterium]